MAGKFSLKMPDFHVAFRDLLNIWIEGGGYMMTVI
jgi:hypothetical protein